MYTSETYLSNEIKKKEINLTNSKDCILKSFTKCVTDSIVVELRNGQIKCISKYIVNKIYTENL